jgi:hypothetical protein
MLWLVHALLLPCAASHHAALARSGIRFRWNSPGWRHDGMGPAITGTLMPGVRAISVFTRLLRSCLYQDELRMIIEWTDGVME